MTNDLIHHIYNSAATVPFTEEEFSTLLSNARSKNASLHITGMLLYAEGCFFQVLEGPEENVNAIAETIRQDPRHTRMTTIIREPIAKRAFSEWSMGFTQMTLRDLDDLDGLNDFFSTGNVLTDLDAGRAKKLLTAFKQGRWRVQLSSATQSPQPATQPGTKIKRIIEPRPAFTFAFQPIVDAAQRTIVGYEALLRASQTGTAADVLQRVELGELGFFDEDARRVAIGLASRLGLTGSLHLNVFPHLWARSGATVIDSSIETAKRCGLDASRIVFELKHEATMSDPRAVSEWLKESRRLGLRINIDDFGSGYSGLALLDHYQPEMISLSIWLIRGIESHGARQAIVRGLIQTCGDLGIDMIAKGVETVEEYAWLRQEGIELFQGFLFAKPGFESLPRPMLPADIL